jgi:predicted phage tail protein|tara:strand:- start:38 stop:481 length:444 start_codon:yes stop_codon:yes gene_type:complete
MIDPATIALATSAFSLIKKGFAAGREIESMSKDLSRWVGACHEIERSHNKAKTRRWGKTVQEEALDTWAAIRKVKKQREELRLFMLSVDPSAWNQLLRLEGQIRKQRIAEEKKRQEEREEIMMWSMALVIFSAVVGFFWLVLRKVLQ